MRFRVKTTQPKNSHGGGSNPSGLIDHTSHRPVAQRSEPAPYKGQTTVRLRPVLLRNTQMGSRC